MFKYLAVIDTRQKRKYIVSTVPQMHRHYAICTPIVACIILFLFKNNTLYFIPSTVFLLCDLTQNKRNIKYENEHMAFKKHIT